MKNTKSVQRCKNTYKGIQKNCFHDVKRCIISKINSWNIVKIFITLRDLYVFAKQY